MKFADTLKKGQEELSKESLHDLNLKLNIDPEKLFLSIGIDPENLVEHSNRFSGCCPCHKNSDNPTAFCYYKNTGIWRCYSNECHVRYQANPIGLIRAVLDLDFQHAIIKGQSIVVSIDISEELLEELRERREVTIKKNKDNYWQMHNEPKETYRENYLNFLIPPETFAKERCIPLDLLKSYGIGYSQNGAHTGRVVVPIRNVKGQIVGSSGRLVVEKEGPKWFHWKPGVFRKEVHLFNINNAFKWNVQNGESTYILVEGPWECMKMEMADVHNSVAVLGRTLTDGQNEVLKRLGASRVLIAMDADERGQEGNKSIYRKLENNLIDTSIINLKAAYSAWNDKELGGLDWGHRLVRPERVKKIIERYTTNDLSSLR